MLLASKELTRLSNLAHSLVAEMLGQQGLESDHLRENRAAGHAGDQVRDRAAAALWMEQIYDR